MTWQSFRSCPIDRTKAFLRALTRIFSYNDWFLLVLFLQYSPASLMASKTSKKQHVRGAIKHFPESALFDARASAGQFMSGRIMCSYVIAS